jgi:hypothetical protein
MGLLDFTDMGELGARLRASILSGLAIAWSVAAQDALTRRRSLQIHFRQCGHRCGGCRANSSRMAWRTHGSRSATIPPTPHTKTDFGCKVRQKIYNYIQRYPELQDRPARITDRSVQCGGGGGRIFPFVHRDQTTSAAITADRTVLAAAGRRNEQCIGAFVADARKCLLKVASLRRRRKGFGWTRWSRPWLTTP